MFPFFSCSNSNLFFCKIMVEFNKELKVKARSEGRHLEQSDVVWDFTAVLMMLMMGGDWWLNGYLSCHSHQWILEIGSLPFSSTKNHILKRQLKSAVEWFFIFFDALLKVFKCSTDMIRWLFSYYYLPTSSIPDGESYLQNLSSLQNLTDSLCSVLH